MIDCFGLFFSMVEQLLGDLLCVMVWVMCIIGFKNIMVFGVGFYSFFNNYCINCSINYVGENCQVRIFLIQDVNGIEVVNFMMGLQMYNLNMIGSVSMFINKGEDVVFWNEIIVIYVSMMGIFRNDGNGINVLLIF